VKRILHLRIKVEIKGYPVAFFIIRETEKFSGPPVIFGLNGFPDGQPVDWHGCECNGGRKFSGRHDHVTLQICSNGRGNAAAFKA